MNEVGKNKETYTSPTPHKEGQSLPVVPVVVVVVVDDVGREIFFLLFGFLFVCFFL